MAHPILAAAFVQVSQVSPAEVNSSWLPLLEVFVAGLCRRHLVPSGDQLLVFTRQSGSSSVVGIVRGISFQSRAAIQQNL